MNSSMDGACNLNSSINGEFCCALPSLISFLLTAAAPIAIPFPMACTRRLDASERDRRANIALVLNDEATKREGEARTKKCRRQRAEREFSDW